MSGFNATPVDGSSPTPIPMSSAVVPGDKTPKAIKAGPATTDSQGNPLSGVSMYTYDGDNETMGFKADAAITNAASSGTFMAFIKGIVKILADVWDGTNHWLQVKVMNGNANGQATMANSAPVAIASDQTQMATSDTLNASGSQEFAIGLLRSNFTQLARMCDASSQGDGTTAPFQFPGVVPYLYNGASIDFQRGNMDNIALLASAARTTTQTVADQKNFNGRGVIVTLDVSSAGTGSITLEIDMKDPVSTSYKSLLTGAAVTTNSTNIYTVYPGAPATANVSANSPLPRTWRVVVTANNANTITYSVGASIIV